MYERERSVQERLLKARAAEPLNRILVGGSHIISWREVFELPLLVILYYYGQTNISVGFRCVHLTINTSNFKRNQRDKLHR